MSLVSQWPAQHLMVVLLFIILNFYRSVVNECCGFEGDDSDSGTSYEDYGDEDEDDAFDDDDVTSPGRKKLEEVKLPRY